MLVQGPFLGGVFSLVTAAVFLLIGGAVSGRRIQGPERLANYAFAFWWYGLGAITGISGALTVAASVGFTDLALHTVFLNVSLIVICVGFWGLAYYLLYIYTGARKWIWFAGGFYGFYLLYFLYIVVAAQPQSVQLSDWGTSFTWERDPASFEFNRYVVLPFLVPLVAAAIAYMALLLRVKLPLQRYRIRLVSGTIIVWFGSSFLASLLTLNSTTWWPLASRAVSLAAGLTVLAAYRPPEFVLRRLGGTPELPAAAKQAMDGAPQTLK